MSVNISDLGEVAPAPRLNRPLSVVNDNAARRTPARRRIVVSGTRVTIVEALSVALNAVDGFEVIGVASSEDSLFRLIEERQPDAVIVHTPRSYPEVVQTTARLKGVTSTARVVLLTERPTGPVLAQAAAAGVAACLPLDTGLQHLIGAIGADTTDTMLVGLYSLAPDEQEPGRPAETSAAVTLTPRELEVLALLAEGCSPPAIAVRLVVSIYTARGHVKNVLRKLGAHSQLEAVAIASRKGLLPRSGMQRTLEGTK
jgi:DNA-binding NarL/FixJ family response regulator